MSVFTTVTPEQLSAWLKNYSIGVLTDLQGIASGIENTNYFVTTTHGRYVLTLFEKLTRRELPFYLNLMAHLSSHGLPCPKPIANLQNALLGELNGKPAAVASCLPGSPVFEPTPMHCARVGEVLAEMHLAGKTYGGKLENLRGAAWWTTCAPEIYPFLSAENAQLLESEIGYQAQQVRNGLPRGVVHADLFRDNVLFDGDRVGGFIDFYFACIDCFVYDVAITVNDWCVDADTRLIPEKAEALLKAYFSVRPFSEQERAAWPWMLRAGALRFWVSRLYDFHLPRPGELTHKHDPERFRRILLNYRGASTAAPVLPK
jgi:homoserine kinase type II